MRLTVVNVMFFHNWCHGVDGYFMQAMFRQRMATLFFPTTNGVSGIRMAGRQSASCRPASLNWA